MNMECMCRVCETVHGLRNMFDEENEELLLMLRSVASVSITAADPLPKYICEHCSHRLQRAYDFRVQCELTDQKLREIIHESKINLAKIKIERVLASNPNNTFVQALSRDETAFNTYGNFKIDSTAPVLEEPKDELEDFESNEGVGRELMKEEVEYVDGDKYELLKEIDSDNIMIVAANEQTTTYMDTCDNIRTENNEIVVIEGETVKFEDIIMEDYSGEALMTDNDDSKAENNLATDEKPGKLDENSQEQSKDQTSLEQAKVDAADGKTNADPSGEKRKRRSNNTSRPKKFQCNSCPEVFTEFRALNEHKRSHGARRFGCPVCGKKFKRRTALRDHIEIHYGKKVQCHLCDRKCSNRGNLDRHIKQCHIRLKPYTCHLCGTSYSRKANLRAHIACHSDERNFDCDECDKKFKTIEHLKAHKRTHIPLEERKKKYFKRYNTRNYICPHCGKTSASLPTHIGHMKIHSDVKPFTCKYCPRTFHFKNSLIVHTFCHTGERPFTCDICGKRFRQSAHVKTHKACIHANHRPFKCQYCTKAFTHSGTLKVHERIHTGEKPYVCEVCDEAYADLKPLKKHKEVVHSIVHKTNRPARLDTVKEGNENQGVKSETSSGGSESEEEEDEEDERERDEEGEKLNEYESEQNNEILYDSPVEACKVEYIHEIIVDQLDVYMGGGDQLGRDESEVIPGVFKSVFYLHKHMKKAHPASNPPPLSKLATVKLKRVESFTCEFCGIISASAAAHKQHLALHGDNKKYCCSVCSREFQSKNYLKTHFRIHTGERPFKCKQCDKAFRQETHLAMHNQSIHSMQKPFACQFCGRGFIVKNYLMQHEKLHRKTKRFECNICFLKFTEEKALAEHKQGEHAELVPQCGEASAESATECGGENTESEAKGKDDNAGSDIESSVERIAEALIDEVCGGSKGTGR